MQLFTSQDINWWTEVLWIVIFYLALILTAHIHCIAAFGEQVMQCYISSKLFQWSKLIYILDGLMESTFSADFIFGRTIPSVNKFLVSFKMEHHPKIWQALI